MRGTATCKDDLARHASLPEQLVRAACLGEGEPLRDERLDLLLLEQVEQRGQVLPEQRGLQPLEPLDAVGDDALAAREKPAGNIVEA